MVKIYLKDDTTAGSLAAPYVAVPSTLAFPATGCSVAFTVCGLTRGLATFAAGDHIVLDYTAEEMRGVKPGVHLGRMVVTDASGRVYTVSDAVRVLFTDSVEVARSASSSLVGDSARPAVRVRAVEEVADGTSMGDLRVKVNELVRIIAGTATALAACVSLGASRLDAIPGSNTVYTATETDAAIARSVTASGGVTPSVATNIAEAVTARDVPGIVTNDVSDVAVGSRFVCGQVYTNIYNDVTYCLTNAAVRWNGSCFEMRIVGKNAYQNEVVDVDGWYRCALTNALPDPYTVVNTDIGSDATSVYIGDKDTTGFSQNIADALVCLADGTQTYTNGARNALGLAYARDVPGIVTNAVPSWALASDPPQGMTTNALVFTNSTVKTLDGSHTVTASDVGAVEGPSNVKFYKDGSGLSHLSVDNGNGMLHFDYGIRVDYSPVYLPNGTFVSTTTGGQLQVPDAIAERATFADATNAANAVVGPLSNDVERVYTFMTGAGAYLQVTNYMRTVAGVVPTLTFWDATNGTATVGGVSVTTNLPWKVYSVADEVAAWTDELREDVDAAKADKAWAQYTSRTGADNPYPDEYTMVTTPNVLLSGGSEYRCVVSNTWILTAQNASRVFSPSDTGVFRVSDADGNSVFEISKTDDMEIGASATSITAGDASIVITYNATAQPTLQASVGSLTNWVSEAGGSVGGFSVAWSNSGTVYTATLTRAGGLALPSQAFFRATYIQSGITSIKHTATSTFDGGIYINSTRYRLVPKTVGGELVLGLQAWSD